MKYLILLILLLGVSTTNASDEVQGYYMSNGVEYTKCDTGICGSDGSKFGKYGNTIFTPTKTKATCTRYGLYYVCKQG